MKRLKAKTIDYSRREVTFGEFVLYTSILMMFIMAIAIGIINVVYDAKIERTERKIKAKEQFTNEDAERAENEVKQPKNHIWQ